MSNKYELIPTQLRTLDGKPLFQVRALRSFGGVRAGDLGGYVEGEHNLSHEGEAWVHAPAAVVGLGCVADHPLVADFDLMPCHRPSMRPGQSRHLYQG